jgi:hypothetical protein
MERMQGLRSIVEMRCWLQLSSFIDDLRIGSKLLGLDFNWLSVLKEIGFLAAQIVLTP